MFKEGWEYLNVWNMMDQAHFFIFMIFWISNFFDNGEGFVYKNELIFINILLAFFKMMALIR